MKQLKRKGFILFNATLIAFFVVACEEDAPKVHELVGTWVATGGTIYYGASVESPDSTTADPQLTNTVLTLVFKEDNTGSITSEEGAFVRTDQFTWSTSGSEIFLVGEDGTSLSNTPITYDINGNTLTITDHQPADQFHLEQWKVVVFQKQ